MRGTTGNSYLARGKTRGSADMYLEHFGLRHPPLGKNLTEPWDDGPLVKLAERFNWLLHSPGIGLLTGEPGVGKTAALRSLTHSLNPHRYQVLYQAETDFGRVDIYRGLARALGWSPTTGVPSSGAILSSACMRWSTPNSSRPYGSSTKRRTCQRNSSATSPRF